MKLDYNLNLVQEQKLIMTQAMQLSIKLLQMSSMELQEYIDKEFSENPLLESKYEKNEDENKTQDRIDYKEMIKYLEFDRYDSKGGYQAYNEESEITPFTFLSNKQSLKEYLHEQIGELKIDKLLSSVCDYIIEDMDEKGYISSSLEAISIELSLPIELVNEALSQVQALEPLGIGARNLRECLKLQLKGRGIKDERLFLMVDNQLENLADNKFPAIAKEMGITVQEAQSLGDIIKSLEPKPSRGFYTGEETNYIVPDAYIKRINDEYFIIMNDSVLPRLSINNAYKDIIMQNNDKEASEYVKEKLNAAVFLIKSIESRRSTLYKVLESIIQRQKEYFDLGEGHLKPMTLKDIASDIGMHESTVSRAIREKYILTERKTIRIKDLFVYGIQKSLSSEDVASSNIKQKIKELIDAENKSKPLSDQAICDGLKAMQYDISRRTVAKYREELGIKSSSKRKRF